MLRPSLLGSSLNTLPNAADLINQNECAEITNNPFTKNPKDDCVDDRVVKGAARHDTCETSTQSCHEEHDEVT